MGRHLQKQRGFADAGIATQERDGAGDDAASEHPIELVLPTAKPGLGRSLLTIESSRHAAHRRRAPSAASDCPLFERVPGRALWTLPLPLECLAGALGTDEDRTGSGHGVWGECVSLKLE